MLHEFKFETKKGVTSVFMDGQELHGVQDAQVDFRTLEIPTVTLTFLTFDILVNSDKTKVRKEV